MTNTLTEQLLTDVCAAIEVLRTRDGMANITHEVAMERARNIVTALLGNYHVEATVLW